MRKLEGTGHGRHPRLLLSVMRSDHHLRNRVSSQAVMNTDDGLIRLH